MHIKKHTSLLFAIIILALAIRLTTMISLETYTFDEMVSVAIAEQPTSELWSYLKWEMHPPLHFLYLHAWIKIFGAGELSTRCSSLILGLLSVAAIYCLALSLFKSRAAALYAALLLALIPFHSFFNVWARMYALLLLLTILSFYFFWQVLNSPKLKTAHLILYAAFTTLALYTHLTALSILLVQFIYLVSVFLRGSKLTPRTFYSVWGTQILAGIIYLPWFIYFITRKLTSLNSGAWYFYSQPGKLYFFDSLIHFFVNSRYALVQYSVLALLFIILGRAFFNIKKQTPDKLKINLNSESGLYLAGLLFILSFLAASFMGLYELRFHVVSSVGILLLASYGLSRFNLKTKLGRIPIIIFLLLITYSGLNSLRLAPPGWQQAVEFISAREQAGDRIITAHINHLLPLQFYYTGSLDKNAIIDKDKTTNDQLRTIIKESVYSSITPGNIDQLNALTQNINRIFLIHTDRNFYSSQKLATDWMLNNGWRIEDEFSYNIFDRPRVWLMVRE